MSVVSLWRFIQWVFHLKSFLITYLLSFVYVWAIHLNYILHTSSYFHGDNNVISRCFGFFFKVRNELQDVSRTADCGFMYIDADVILSVQMCFQGHRAARHYKRSEMWLTPLLVVWSQSWWTTLLCWAFVWKEVRRRQYSTVQYYDILVYS